MKTAAERNVHARKAAHVPGRHTTGRRSFTGGYKMDYSAISDIVSNFGFPIAVAVAMFWYVNKQDERHREEMGEMRKTLEENTSVLSGLKDIISVFITKMGD